MAFWGRSPLLLAVPLWMSFGGVAAALSDPEVCYILDGILFLYGIILTALYCKIKIQQTREAEAMAETKKAKGKKKIPEESIYTGLTPHAADTYETIGTKK
ncbi:high affinity immunoglobulin epsilon receptor subunit gamma [Labrus bergylta]|uniref:high affinity immunoglobulin epsilon receptor subunit gamma n=1 Tax=Labrus bergylta TaxID=56723 RepID=UPI0009B37E85|nr:high affinity immunoglobulin epsilon receptor subunit gamma [Labrus bergylta]